ncbi:hypothetical protein NUSPORA_00831 [Nucleospora cyclopteri]
MKLEKDSNFFNNILKAEVAVLNRVIKRSKCQFRGHQVLRRMKMLHKKLEVYFNSKKLEKKKMVDIIENIYIGCSNDLTNGFFVPFNMVTMAICGRIFYLIKRIK